MFLRPPGTINYKDARSGRRPQDCRLLVFRPEVRYPLDAFSYWIELAQQEQLQRVSQPLSIHSMDTSGIEALAKSREIKRIVRRLKRPTRDRSRRDFAIICQLLRHGLGKDQIWKLVAGSSKFAAGGRPYFDRTIANAERSIHSDLSLSGQTEPIV